MHYRIHMAELNAPGEPLVTLDIDEDYIWTGPNANLVRLATGIPQPPGAHHAIDPLKLYVDDVVITLRTIGLIVERVEVVDATLLDPLPDDAIS